MEESFRKESIKSPENTHFSGLELCNEIGEIHLPFGAKMVDMKGPAFEETFVHPMRGEHKTYVNKEKLNGHLLEVNGATLFSAMQGRIFVVARVGNIHLPFYVSQAGTDGKIAGSWYPFFGYHATWLVKGKLTNKEKGEMDYHPEVTRVADLLNQNLIIPMNIFSSTGDLDPAVAEKSAVKNLNEIIPFQHYSQDKSGINHSIDSLVLLYEEMKTSGFIEIEQKMRREKANEVDDMDEKKKIITARSTVRKIGDTIKGLKSTSEHQFVEKITGYSPKEPGDEGSGKVSEWIESIVEKI